VRVDELGVPAKALERDRFEIKRDYREQKGRKRVNLGGRTMSNRAQGGLRNIKKGGPRKGEGRRNDDGALSQSCGKGWRGFGKVCFPQGGKRSRPRQASGVVGGPLSSFTQVQKKATLKDERKSEGRQPFMPGLGVGSLKDKVVATRMSQKGRPRLHGGGGVPAGQKVRECKKTRGCVSLGDKEGKMV